MPVRVIALMAALSACAFGQFSSLTTPADGSMLYFSTQLAVKSTSQPTYGKIFDIDSFGLHLLYSRDVSPPNQDRICSDTATELTGISTSSDGSVLAVAGLRDCECYPEQMVCMQIDPYVTTIFSGGRSRDYPGEIWLSRSGRLALQKSGVYFAFSSPTYNVIELATGAVNAAYLSPAQHGPYLATVSLVGRPLADNGTAVLTTSSLLILSGGTIQTLLPPASNIFADATIDASGHTILLTARNLQTNRSSLRITSPGVPTTDLFVSDGYLPSMTDDGRLVVYLSARAGTPQAYLIGTDGNGDHALTHEPDGLAEAIISGDGTTVYTLTLGGRLLKIAAGTGAVRELVPRTPYLTAPPRTLARGGRAIISGRGLATGSFSATPPLPESLGGLSVSIGGTPAPLLNVTPTSVDFLVPPNARQGDIFLQMDPPAPSPFETPLELQYSVANTAPEVLQTVHQDWSQPVSYDTPAHPGEVLHTYAFGLGATAPAVPFDQAAPIAEPLALLAPPLTCLDITGMYSPGYVQYPIDVPYAGLAPGMVAVYQVDWRVPANAAQYDHINAWCISTTTPLPPFGWEIVVPIASAP